MFGRVKLGLRQIQQFYRFLLVWQRDQVEGKNPASRKNTSGDGLLTPRRPIDFCFKPDESILSLTIYERHKDVKNPQKTISLILSFLSFAILCPPHPLMSAETRQGCSAESLDRYFRYLVNLSLKCILVA